MTMQPIPSKFLTYEVNSIIFSFSSVLVNDKTIANVADKLA